MKRLSLYTLFPVLLLMVACSGLQQSDKDFILDQAVIRSLEAADPGSEAEDRAAMWERIATGLRTVAADEQSGSGAIDEAVTALVMKATEGKNLNIADKRALDYIAQRLVPKDIDASVPLSEDTKARILRAATTIEDAVVFWRLYGK